ncbi:MAG: hypothetical protein HY306_13810 [Nitrosomonadales bacterium]|nr:hypothetical protein [Nitrosomonadales bacterium]
MENTVQPSGATSGTSILGGASINGAAANIGLVQFVNWQLIELSKLHPQTANIIGAANMSGFQACPGGGSFSYHFNDANNNGTLSIGETFYATLNNCIMTGGAPVNGSFSLVLSSATGTPGIGAWSASLTMTFSNFASSGESITGDMTFSISTNNSSDMNEVLSGSSFSVTNSTGKVATLSGYNYDMAYNQSTLAYTFNATGTVSRSDLGGAVSFNTPSPLVGNFSNNPDNPVSGVFLVTGANNSKLRMTAIDNISVQLEVDADGNGTYETSTTKTWAGIAAL